MSNEKKPDFGGVQGTVRGNEGVVPEKPDFSGVQGTVRGEGLPAEGTQYTVEKGDTLSHIAKHFYGRASKWHAIFDANRDQLDDPDRIQPGQVLTIPAIDLDGDGVSDSPK
ncbi:Peptidoglycan-binding lysin domain-containing protein [Lysobacter dokdonensis DS-58]|uniref:Peptidoglycan-binding lysin domain-containing protein n=1 Tax=Lysobacter dokdonensis DS-58 TaxID=1300345 RepID=A0A0A2WI51_9GAMM|nr:LysM peptidoglycan-binding domain-containing protein [Lysobacter dokdonensis]KGQ18387.1 Peptidoglycan-binding lysin domain-containing protein [Lysobacter dokdonensis DS-58]